MRPFRVPRRLRVRPQFKGLPIPYVALIGEDGLPDFRVTDEGKRRSVILNRWCQLCGEPLGKWFFFTGGTECAKNNCYFEPACHLDCLLYAMQVCPFIIGKMEHAPIAKVQADNPHVAVHADSTFAPNRNPYWVIKKATGWKIGRTRDNTVLLMPLGVVKETKPLHPETMTAADWKEVEDYLI